MAIQGEHVRGDPDEDWRLDALCAQVDLEIFFPEKGESVSPAISVCRMCTVSDDCLSYALADPTLLGVWGGTSQAERRRMRKLLAG